MFFNQMVNLLLLKKKKGIYYQLKFVEASGIVCYGEASGKRIVAF